MQYLTKAVWLLAMGLALGPFGMARADDSCLKEVFNRFCLGGDFNALLRQPAPPQYQQQQGDRRAAVYSEGLEQLFVLAFQDRIYKVVRQYQPGTHLRYQDLLTLLTDKYGPYEDHSQFPAYAESRAGRVAAIRRGEGRAVHVWRPEPGWHLELSWTREMSLALSYVATELDEQQRQRADQGL